jgi:hypothetical protein
LRKFRSSSRTTRRSVASSGSRRLARLRAGRFRRRRLSPEPAARLLSLRKEVGRRATSHRGEFRGRGCSCIPCHNARNLRTLRSRNVARMKNESSTRAVLTTAAEPDFGMQRCGKRPSKRRQPAVHPGVTRQRMVVPALETLSATWYPSSPGAHQGPSPTPQTHIRRRNSHYLERVAAPVES